MKRKDGGSYFYKNKKYRRLEKEKYVFFSYFILVIPNFSYMNFFRKCSMFRRSIPLMTYKDPISFSKFKFPSLVARSTKFANFQNDMRC